VIEVAIPKKWFDSSVPVTVGAEEMPRPNPKTEAIDRAAGPGVTTAMGRILK
jgi:hypothetical protein